MLVAPDVIVAIIVTYRSADVIRDCLESLMTSNYGALKVIVCDNNSPDDTVDTIRTWATGRSLELTEFVADSENALEAEALGRVTLIRSLANLGFAGGVNLGLKTAIQDPDVGLFWILNPDCVVMPETASAFVESSRQDRFALMGGRILYLEPPNAIQSDGGRVSHWTGVCTNLNQGLSPLTAVRPDPATMDFISGANMVASREFVDKAGLMREDYFLYFEEVDWAFQRGGLPLRFCQEAIVHHHGGTVIGTGSATRRANAFANYFNFRNRIRFVGRFMPQSLPVAYAYNLLKIAKLVCVGAWEEAAGAFRGLHQLPPSKAVAEKLAPEAAARAFGGHRRSTNAQ